jgi:hypothetical protein
MSAADLLKAVEELPPQEFADFVVRIAALRARDRTPCLPAEEARLLKKINRGFADSWWKHYRNLLEKRQDESLSTEQRRELIRLTDVIEKRETERLAALVELAGRRRQTLTELMSDLGLLETRNA